MLKSLSAAAIALLIAAPAMAQTATPATPATPAVKAAPADTAKTNKDKADKADKAKGKSSHNVDLGKQQAQVPATDKKATPATPASPAAKADGAKSDVKSDANKGDTRKVN